ncbi:PREDICTED: zinc transporter foi [Ceratosolen solmsi marchali]|uniref:Zinc transporter foi n=1 Tax=Ceratosolen solmsi marchali TaxID=326594 RepID=A0AAJ6YSK3_9HYME|nr:PREDICTED: zinc transporter foi [Ceratosolen solmsi marchali]
MAQHFVTICVVCVLCAAHIPCYAHMNILPTVKQRTESVKYSTESSDYSEYLFSHSIGSTKMPKKTEAITKDFTEINNNENLFNKVPEERIQKSHYDHRLKDNLENSRVLQESRQKELLDRLGQNYLESQENGDFNDKNMQNLRSKRSLELDEKYFTKKIFELYGDGENMTMEGFEKLLRKMGLFQSEPKVSEQEIHSIDSNQSGNRFANVNESQSNNDDRGTDKTLDTKQRCLNSRELLSVLSNDVTYTSSSNNSTTLPVWLFERVCPVLIYQLTAVSAAERGGCVYVSDNYKSSEIGSYEEETARNMFQVWIYSTVSILVISLCGLLGVAVIPVMGKSYYHQLLQFLVALAVGTLCGDALIHLLPHAMMSESQHSHSHENSQSHLPVDHREDEHNTNMWKGFVAVIGLVMFFFTEKALNIISEWRRYNQNRSQIPARVRVMRDSDTGNSNTVGEKLCKHKYSTYPYCYGEIETEIQDNLRSHQHNHHERPQTIEEEKPLTCNSTNCNSVSNKIVQNDIEKKNNEEWKLDDTVITDIKKTVDGADVPLNEVENYTVIIKDHDTKHHGHGHSHNHVHSTPDSMSSVAWMVVMGDGLHNFTDGMAIGAAFSANIAGGFSTTIAVFCHELPHELGDFAVLLKAGMSAKQAVFYNLLSSVLCIFGMVFGVLLGATPAASSWMFAAAAGMFIYIALVDMIPELSTNHSVAHGAHWQCLLQAAGLICGFGIMLIIALYEHDLQHIFSN